MSKFWESSFCNSDKYKLAYVEQNNLKMYPELVYFSVWRKQYFLLLWRQSIF